MERKTNNINYAKYDCPINWHRHCSIAYTMPTVYPTTGGRDASAYTISSGPHPRPYPFYIQGQSGNRKNTCT